MTPISAHILQQAIELYVQYAYPNGTLPPAVQERAKAIRDLSPSQNVPESLLEKESGASLHGYALRLGQPLYPHMKLIIEPAPADPTSSALPNAIPFLLRVDSHDRHLHAAPGSPDEAWLSNIRASNKQVGERIEAAWSQHGLPTFKDYLRSQLAARKAQQSHH
ncbi:MAG TPA: hypothetical protein VM008_11340 [Phycisphaerae bacterium]|nr:hypothetical protein [Phycisphaerae bacterium]